MKIIKQNYKTKLSKSKQKRQYSPRILNNLVNVTSWKCFSYKHLPPPPPPPFPVAKIFFSKKIGKRKIFICEEHARFSLFIAQDISDKK